MTEQNRKTNPPSEAETKPFAETTELSGDGLFPLDEPEYQQTELVNAINTLIHTVQRQTDLIFRALEIPLLFVEPQTLTGNEKDSASFQEWRSRLMPYLAFIKKSRHEGTSEKDIIWPQIQYVIGRTRGDARRAANELARSSETTVHSLLDSLEEWWKHWQESRK